MPLRRMPTVCHYDVTYIRTNKYSINHNQSFDLNDRKVPVLFFSVGSWGYLRSSLAASKKNSKNETKTILGALVSQKEVISFSRAVSSTV